MKSIHRKLLMAAAISAGAVGFAGAASAQSQPGYYISGEGGRSGRNREDVVKHLTRFLVRALAP